MDIQWFTPFIKHSSIDMHICVLMVYRCVFWLLIAWSCSETPWTALSQRCRVSSSDVGSYSCRCIPWTWFVLKLSRSPEGSDVSAVASYPRCVHFLPWLHDRRTLWTLLQCHFAGMLVMLSSPRKADLQKSVRIRTPSSIGYQGETSRGSAPMPKQRGHPGQGQPEVEVWP